MERACNEQSNTNLHKLIGRLETNHDLVNNVENSIYLSIPPVNQDKAYNHKIQCRFFIATAPSSAYFI